MYTDVIKPSALHYCCILKSSASVYIEMYDWMRMYVQPHAQCDRNGTLMNYSQQRKRCKTAFCHTHLCHLYRAVW